MAWPKSFHPAGLIEKLKQKIASLQQQWRRQVIAVPLPAQCGCGGALKVEKIEPQYQHEVVRKTIWRRFDIAVGRCRRCGRRVQGRDPRQTSDALGAAAVQLGPEALALAVRMNKGLGMPHGDVAAVLPKLCIDLA